MSHLSSGLVAEGQIVYIDLGDRDGVRTGDIFLIYRPLTFDNSLYDFSPKTVQVLGPSDRSSGNSSS